jgi:hypothetical protein
MLITGADYYIAASDNLGLRARLKFAAFFAVLCFVPNFAFIIQVLIMQDFIATRRAERRGISSSIA